jgi:VWFA-related protein
MRLQFATGVVAIMAAAVMAQGQPPPNQSPQPPPEREQPAVTFKVEVNYVEVDAIVTDARGNPVRGLTRDDFEVFEDGQPQNVSVFAPVDIPVERMERPLYRPTPVEPDVRTNAEEFDGRLFVIVLDDLHTNALRSGLVKRAAHEFIERYIGANDMAAVLPTSGRTDLAQDFTSSRTLLLRAVDRFLGRKLRSATLGMIDQYYINRGTPNQGDKLTDPDDLERGYHAQSLLKTLDSLAEWMGGIRGRRKSVVLFSEGIDYDINNPFDNKYASTIIEDTRQLIGTATRNNVSIYSVDPRGLTSLADEAIEIQATPDDNSISSTALLNGLRMSQDSLRVISDQTGGFAAVNTNDFQTAFSRIIEENSAYYVLGYYPTSTQRNGRFRKIEVRVTKPGYTVKARKGYVAPKGKAATTDTSGAAEGTSAALREALASPLPISGLTLSAFAAPFKGADKNASVVVSVEVPGTDFAFAERDGRFVDDLETSLIALDESGKVRGGDRNTMKLDLRPQTHAILARYGVRFTSRVTVPPGRYQLRIAAREGNARRVGSLIYDLNVPDFSEDDLVMSGLVVTSAGASRTPTPKEDEELKKVLPGPPTTQREFFEGDTLGLFTEVYDNQPAKPHTVDITTTLVADEGRVVYKTEDTRKSDELKGVRGGYGYVAEVPLKGVAPGLYVLRVEARSRLGGETQVREVQLRVVPGAATGPSR